MALFANTNKTYLGFFIIFLHSVNGAGPRLVFVFLPTIATPCHPRTILGLG